jgi:peptidylprolyl isomerase
VPQPAYAVKEVTVGTGTDKATLAENGDLVAVAYTAYLYDAAQPDGIGKKVESSVDIGTTASPFVLGVGGTVGLGGTIPQGWDLAVPGMRVGGVRLATLPANLAYGAAAREAVKAVNGNTYEPIKANSPLVYRLQLVGVTKASELPRPQPGGTNFVVMSETLGTGATATSGKSVTVRYTGWLYDPAAANGKGAQFDSNATSTTGLPLVVDSAPLQVISGFNTGVRNMNVGGKRTIYIPANLGYGSTAQPGIPANSNLVFDIELLTVK